jgi:hypothetical protein
MRTYSVRLLLAALFALVLAAPAQAARPLTTGFFDEAFGTADAARLDEAVASGAGIVRLTVTWSAVAPVKPRRQRDPADPVYRWGGVDAAVAAARARRLQVLLTVDRAPGWAEGGGRRAPQILAGSWKPSPAAVGAFVEAVGRRYPQVRFVQLWNEPNLAKYLAPQWSRGRLAGAARYRQMLNAAFAGLRRAGRRARLVTGGTAPYGDPDPGGARVMPVRFWRGVLQRRVRFDILAHHPYAVRGPRAHALNSGDVAVPDMGKLTRLVRQGTRSGKVLPRGRKRFWVTEMSWDSSPPDPNGIPAARHAAWLADAFYVLWKQGVDSVFWFQVRDAAPVPTYDATHQSGIYLRDGTPKLAQRAFAFPFACRRAGSRTLVWTRAPARGPVEIRDAAGRVAGRLRAGADRIATGFVTGRGVLRARSAGTDSLPCRP